MVSELVLINSMYELMNELVIEYGGMWNDHVWMRSEGSLHIIDNFYSLVL